MTNSASRSNSQPELADTCLVTGANDRYFWLVNTALQSVKELNPGAKVRVMDFGFTPAQAQFFASQDLLLPRPPQLPSNVHPYTLKTFFGLYAEPLREPNLVWFDSDMLCVGPLVQRLESAIKLMRDAGKTLAMAADMGPNATLSAFTSAFHAPALKSFIDAAPARANNRYLNSGCVIFASANAILEAWPRLTARIQGETCIDQNALNMLFYQNPAQTAVLDAKIWNAHGDLLAHVETDGDRITCQGVSPILLHCTSNRNAHHQEVVVNMAIAGSQHSLPFKTFRHAELRRRHLATLERFTKQNAASLQASGVI